MGGVRGQLQWLWLLITLLRQSHRGEARGWKEWVEKKEEHNELKKGHTSTNRNQTKSKILKTNQILTF